MSMMSAKFFLRNLLFVIERGRDWFELELDVPEASPAHRLFELILRSPIGRRIIVDKMDRSAEHDIVHGFADAALQALFEIKQKRAYHVGKRNRVGFDTCLFLDERRAQHALECAQQPAIDIIRVAADGAATEISAVVLETEEDGAWHCDLSVLQLNKLRPAIVDEPDCGIGRAKVDAAAHRPHGLSSELVIVSFSGSGADTLSSGYVDAAQPPQGAANVALMFTKTRASLVG
jgi:hypothetical protein